MKDGFFRDHAAKHGYDGHVVDEWCRLDVTQALTQHMRLEVARLQKQMHAAARAFDGDKAAGLAHRIDALEALLEEIK